MHLKKNCIEQHHHTPEHFREFNFDCDEEFNILFYHYSIIISIDIMIKITKVDFVNECHHFNNSNIKY